jgi:hypothetical protein
VAIKFEKVHENNSLEREFEVMKTIQKHPNLIEYIEFVKNVERVDQVQAVGLRYLTLEYA